MTTLLALLAIVGGRHAARRLPHQRHGRPPGIGSGDIVLLSDLIVLGLLAGMPFAAALSVSARHVHPSLGDEIRRVMRCARVDGTAVTFASAKGPLARLLALAARAVSTGAPLAAAVAAFADEARNAERARAVADARRLAVRLLFPLTLLILPGFVVLVAGPVVLESLARLDL